MNPKLLILFFIFLIPFISCDKKGTVQEFPEDFTKKILFEEFSGEWCASCVEGAKVFESLLNENPEKYIGVGLHQGDPFEISFPSVVNFLLSEFEIVFFPYTLVNRTIEENKGWSVIAESKLAEEAKVGIKIITEIKNNNINATIEIASNENLDNVFLTIYIVEDHVPESSPGAQNGGGENYVHRHVLRQVLTNKLGDPITLTQDQILNKSFTDIKLGQYNLPNIKLIAFVHYGSTKAFEVLNVNSIKAGETSDW